MEGFVIRFKNGLYNKGHGHAVRLSDATVYAEALDAEDFADEWLVGVDGIYHVSTGLEGT